MILLSFFQKNFSYLFNKNIFFNKNISNNLSYFIQPNKFIKQIKKNKFNSYNQIKESSNEKYEQKIIFIKSNKILSLIDGKPIEELNCVIKSKLMNKKIVHITPGGLYGFYDAAICKIIKEKYILNEYIFNGASAGAWNSLLMVYKNDHNKLITEIFNHIKKNQTNCIKTTQLNIKNTILSNTHSNDFELDKLFITVCVWDNGKINNYIYTDFETLECAIECCIASSNIPLLTGNLIYKYKGKISFDGGFLKKSHITIKNPDFTITNTLFGKKRFFTSLFDSRKNISNLYIEGLNDTLNNITYLDNVFMS